MDNQHKCKECRLYSPKNKLCAVIIPLTQEMQKELGVQEDRLQLKPNPNDTCFYEQEFRALDKDNMKVERFKLDVQQIKMWVEENGAKGKDGKVFIEYPENFLPEGFLSGKMKEAD